MRAHRTFIALFTVAALGLAACGGDDGGSDEASTDGAVLTALEREYADAVAAEFSDSDPDEFVVTDEEAECMAVAMMSILGSDVFEDNGVTPEDFEGSDGPGQLVGEGVIPEEDASAVVDEWLECADLTGQLAEEMNGSSMFDAEGLACLERELDASGFAHDMFVLKFTSASEEPPAEFSDRFLDVVAACSPSGSGGGPAALFAEGLVEAGVSEADANCVAENLFEELGLERMAELGAAGNFEDWTAEQQAELGALMMRAYGDCGVPLTSAGG